MNVSGLVNRFGRKTAAGAALLGLCISLFVGVGHFASAAINPADAENEEIALSLATLLRSARAVISDNQKHINDASKGDKGLSSAAVLAKAKANYKAATGVDIDSIDPSTMHGELIRAEMDAIGQVMDEAQQLINEPGTGYKGFLPAIFARLVTGKFRARRAMLPTSS